MTDIERIIATIKDYQDKNLSLEDLQSYFQTLPLCLYFSAQQIEELEEQLETIRFLISDADELAGGFQDGKAQLRQALGHLGGKPFLLSLDAPIIALPQMDI